MAPTPPTPPTSPPGAHPPLELALCLFRRRSPRVQCFLGWFRPRHLCPLRAAASQARRDVGAAWWGSSVSEQHTNRCRSACSGGRCSSTRTVTSRRRVMGESAKGTTRRPSAAAVAQAFATASTRSRREACRCQPRICSRRRWSPRRLASGRSSASTRKVLRPATGSQAARPVARPRRDGRSTWRWRATWLRRTVVGRPSR